MSDQVTETTKEIIVSLIATNALSATHSGEANGSTEKSQKLAQNIGEAYKIIYDVVKAKLMGD